MLCSQTSLPLFCPLLQSAIVIAICFSCGLTQETSPDGGPVAACAAADSLDRMSDFFARNSDSFEADGYFGLSTAALAVNSAPLSAVAARLGGGSCGGDSGLVELRRTMARIGRLLDRFKSRVAAGGGGGGSSDYNGVTYRRIIQPMEAIFRRLLSPAVFRWRRLGEDGGGGDSGGNGTGSASWLMTMGRGLFSYSERLGDACFRSILAARRKRCPVSPECRRLFLKSRPTIGYTLTHQFMYWMVGIYKSCNLRLSNGRQVDKALLRDACRRAYAEHRKILRGLTTVLIDLALEQAVLCGVLGYRDFFSDSTVLLLRRLQNERLGCFDDIILAKTGSAGATAEPVRSGGRRLMHDALLEGTCSSHTSGLAAAYFALSLRT